MIELTDEKVRTYLDEAIAEKGADYNYKLENGGEGGTCLYLTYDRVEDYSRPTGYGCLVGAVLLKAGVPKATLAALEGNHARVVIDQLVHAGVLSCSKGVRDALREAQKEQDRGHDWGTARSAYAARSGSFAY